MMREPLSCGGRYPGGLSDGGNRSGPKLKLVGLIRLLRRNHVGQKGDHDLGRTYLDPNNVGASGGNLEVELPANSLNGGESGPKGSTATVPTRPA